MKKQKYAACWYCDNTIDHPEQVGLLYLGFPRCFVLIPSSKEFYFSTFEEFVGGISQVNWLDPSDKGTELEREEVLRTLWNFSVEQEKKKKTYIMNRIEIGEKIKEIRGKRGLSVRALSELTGYSYVNISRIENGKYSVGIDILNNILDKLDAKLEIIEKAAE